MRRHVNYSEKCTHAKDVPRVATSPGAFMKLDRSRSDGEAAATEFWKLCDGHTVPVVHLLSEKAAACESRLGFWCRTWFGLLSAYLEQAERSEERLWVWGACNTM